MNTKDKILIGVILDIPDHPKHIGEHTEELKPGQLVEILYDYIKGGKLKYAASATLASTVHRTMGWTIPAKSIEIIGEL